MTTDPEDPSTTRATTHSRAVPRLRAAVTFMLALVASASFLAGTAGAQDEGDALAQEGENSGRALGVGGTIRFQGEALEGVVVVVETADGDEVGEGVTGVDGTWQVDVPEPGQYTATIALDTLPSGVTVSPGNEVREVTAQRGLVRQLAFPLVAEGDEGVAPSSIRPAGPTLAARIIDRSVDGVKFGLIIGMAAIGLSLIYGTTGLINFAHGELVTFGAIVAWFINVEGPQLWLVWAAVIATLATACIGGGLELGLWAPLRARGTGLFQMMVISIGLSLAFRQGLLIWFGSEKQRYVDFTVQSEFEWGPFAVTPRDLVIMGIAVGSLVLVALVLQYTRIGKAMRAVSDDPDLAESSGIDVRRVILFVWVAGAGLAGLGGVLQSTTTTVDYLNGFQLLLLMFAAIILGGIGTAYGAMIGGLVVGLATEVSTVWLNTELKMVWALAVLILVLLVRPQGILGTRERVG